IVVNGGAASYVNLRGLTIQGIGFGGGTGMRVNGGYTLTIANCVFRNNTGSGIEFYPATGPDSHLAVSHTLPADSGVNGVTVGRAQGNASVWAVLNRVEAYNNGGDGVFVDGNGAQSSGRLNMIAIETAAVHNVNAGFDVRATNG